MDNLDFASIVEHLTHPLALIGFALLLFTSVFKKFNFEKVSNKDNAGLLGKVLNIILVLSVLLIVLGFGSRFVDQYNESEAQNQPNSSINTGQDLNVKATNGGTASVSTGSSNGGNSSINTEGSLTVTSDGGTATINTGSQ